MVYALCDFPEKAIILLSGLISGLKRTQIFSTESRAFFNNISYIKIYNVSLDPMDSNTAKKVLCEIII